MLQLVKTFKVIVKTDPANEVDLLDVEAALTTSNDHLWNAEVEVQDETPRSAYTAAGMED